MRRNEFESGLRKYEEAQYVNTGEVAYGERVDDPKKKFEIADLKNEQNNRFGVASTFENEVKGFELASQKEAGLLLAGDEWPPMNRETLALDTKSTEAKSYFGGTEGGHGMETQA